MGLSLFRWEAPSPTCFYCRRVLEGRYETKGINVSKLCAVIGTSEEEHHTFMALLDTAKDKFVMEGRRNLRFDWSEVEEEVKVIKKPRLKITEAKDTCIPYADYLQAMGDPVANGYKVV